MKITYLKLENFIGIKYGMDRNILEIDFTKGDHRSTLFQAANGHGKTTILSTLHPYSGTMDDRTSIILPDKDGYKEIHFVNGDDEYIIKHHYLNKRKNKQIKSFISKNGEELNENGTVKSFEEIVERELDVTPSFFILSRIGSNVKNFIGLKPAERKNYMSKFLPDVSIYLDYYKKVNNNYNAVNKKIKSLTAEINKLDDEENLKAQETNLSKNLKLTTKNLESIMKKINENNGVLSTMNSEEISSQYDTAEEKLKKVKKNRNTTMEIFTDASENINPDDPYTLDTLNLSEIVEKDLKKVKKKLNEVEKSLTENITLLSTTNGNIESLKGEINKLNEELSSYQLDKDIDEFKDMKDEYGNKLKFNKKKMENYDDKYKLNMSDEDVNIILQFFNYIQESTIFNDYDMSIIDEFKRNSKYLTEDGMIDKVYKTEYGKMENLRKNLDQREKTLIEYQSKLDLKEVLKKRPKECKIDSCSFIAEAVKYSDVDKSIERLEDQIKKLQEKEELMNELIDKYENMVTFRKDFVNTFNSLKNFANYNELIKLLPNNFENYENFLEFIKKDKNPMLETFHKAIEYATLFVDTQETEKLIKEVDYNIEILSSKDKLIKKTKKDLANKNDELSNKKKAKIEYSDNISKFTTDRDELTEKEENYNEILSCLETFDKLDLIEDKYQNLKNKVYEDMKTIKCLNGNNEELMKDYGEQSKVKDNLQEQLDDVKYKLKRLQEFKENLAEMNEKYNNIEIIRKALSPTKGIPLLFVETYLRKTRNIANRLLDVAYHGRFYIDDFELTDSDFFIKIVKDGNMLIQDVTLTSQGEMSLISLAFNFALIEQSKKKYDVILLDEIDKELDADNRRAFVDILEKQLEDMDVEQCFIISHNQEFDTSALDLILLGDHEVDIENEDYMKNKTIIFEG